MKLDVWEYVRLMVALESLPKSVLLKREGDAWQELDHELARLAEDDHGAYSDMMLNATADLGSLTDAERKEARAAFTLVIDDLRKAEASADAELKHALILERKALSRRLKAL